MAINKSMMEENKYITINDINKLINENHLLYFYSRLIEHYGHNIELKLYEDHLNSEKLEYKEYEQLSELLSFIQQQEVSVSDLMSSDEETTNTIIDKSIVIKNDVTFFEEKYNISKEQLQEMIKRIDKELPLFKIPNYYLSFPYIFEFILYHIMSPPYGIEQKEVEEKLMDNLGIMNLFGGKDPIPTKLFNDTISVLKKITTDYIKE